MHTPGLGFEPLRWRRLGEIAIQVDKPEDVSVRGSRGDLVQIPRLDKSCQPLAALEVVCRVCEFNRAGDVDLVEPDPRLVESPDRLRHVLELNRLVTDVVTDTQVLAGSVQNAPPVGFLEQLAEKRQCFLCGLQQAQWLGFDRQPHAATGLLETPATLNSPLQQRIDGLADKAVGLFEVFETQRDGRDAPVGPLGQQLGENPGTGQCVIETLRGGPVGQVDLLFDPLAVKISVRERVERVADKSPFGELFGQTQWPPNIGGQLGDHRSRQPQSGCQGLTEGSRNRYGVTVQSRHHFLQAPARMDVRAVTQRQSTQAHRVRQLPIFIQLAIVTASA